ncbi:hypothetical protein [Rhizobium leguminosarum]|uniref:hypothetical protein n=1 Tax=Rhizobium leguminosarum TaxID=384 RepID=UPI001030B3CE|nr:hypothetical protein [Rhizobium leguminosarum]TAU13193.1 hypothetical protein ELI50_36405 [Rhizobium leguminosarum]
MIQFTSGGICIGLAYKKARLFLVVLQCNVVIPPKKASFYSTYWGYWQIFMQTNRILIKNFCWLQAQTLHVLRILAVETSTTATTQNADNGGSPVVWGGIQ